VASAFTQANGINPAGTVTGYFDDVNFVAHGFVRTPDGSITTFDVAGSAGTDPIRINPGDAMVGDYLDANSVSHGFVRTRDGSITTFDERMLLEECY
jgi:hypothetical protein